MTERFAARLEAEFAGLLARRMAEAGLKHETREEAEYVAALRRFCRLAVRASWGFLQHRPGNRRPAGCSACGERTQPDRVGHPGVRGTVRNEAPVSRSDVDLPALRWLPLLLACFLAACGGGGGQRVVASYRGPANYAPPGPPSDPWGPYIGQAAGRFGVPQPWIRTVIHQESGGRQYLHGQPITSDAGAMGLMQIMPATYSELAGRFGLGQDPYDPHDNIMAGTGYIKDLYQQFGSPAFLAAYNAGPHRVQMYLAGHGSLPNETVNYLASAAPGLGRERPVSGPLAAFAEQSARPAAGPVLHDFAQAPAARCWQDPDAAYDPAAPCHSAPPPALVQTAVAVAPPVPVGRYARPAANCWQDPDAAYDPAAPCRNPPAAAAPAPRVYAAAPPRPAHCWQDPNAAYDPGAPCRAAPAPAQASRATPVRVAAAAPYRFPGSLAVARAQGAPIRPAMATGRWAIQVGAFATPEQARRTAESVRSLAPGELGSAQAVLGTTEPFGGQVMYRARLLGLSAQNAAAACRDLRAQAQSCVPVAPGG